MMQTWRFRPYETPGARSNEYTNAEAGPSTLAPPFVPYVVTPATYPSGGLSEATADAEYNLTITEEDAAPVSNFYRPHIPHVTDDCSATDGQAAPRHRTGTQMACPLSGGYAQVACLGERLEGPQETPNPSRGSKQ